MIKVRQIEDYTLPKILSEITGQTTVPIGDGVLATPDTCIGSEVCEEMFSVHSNHVAMAREGVEIMTNGSGSHHELRKLNKRVKLATSATFKVNIISIFFLLQNRFETKNAYLDLLSDVL